MKVTQLAVVLPTLALASGVFATEINGNGSSSTTEISPTA